MITKEILLDMYMRCSTQIPKDIEERLRESNKNESSDIAKSVLNTVLENIDVARTESKPICQDTGTPIFYVCHPQMFSQKEMSSLIKEATIDAGEMIPLRPNAVEPISGKNIGNSPIMHFEESDRFRIDLLMKGGGSENISSIYSLPDTELKAKRDLEGIKKSVLDAVFRAQGKGCSPYVIGVAIGGNIEEVAHLSKKQLLRNLNYPNEDKVLNKLETELVRDINRLGIGPMGLGGKTTALGVNVTKSYRHPASFFVGISFGCWALRRSSYEPEA